MRNREKLAVAVRLENGQIKVKKSSSKNMPKIYDKPFIRGVVGLVYMLHDGIGSLVWSANQQVEEEEKIEGKEMVFTLITSFLLALVIFVGIPFGLAYLVSNKGFWFHVVDGVLRVVLFVGYLGAISFMKDTQRLFEYHGAEHKAVNCHESGELLCRANARKHSRFSPRCGTSFIFIVLVLSVLLFSLIGGSWVVRLLSRVLLIPVIAGIAYELLRLGDKFKESRLMKTCIAPGLWLQRMTTREPNDEQLEVAIRALKEVVK